MRASLHSPRRITPRAAVMAVALVLLVQATALLLGATPAEAIESTDKIAENPPDLIDALVGGISGTLAAGVWAMMTSLTGGLCSIVKWVLGILDKSMTGLFLQDFGGDGANLQPLHLAAEKVSNNVAIPFGTAFLGVVFGIALIQTSDPRHRRAGAEWMHGFLGVILMFAVSWTLIYHAMDLCGMVYDVSYGLVKWLTENLGADAGGVGAKMAENITSSLMQAQLQVTYGGFGMSILIMIVALVAVFACVGCVLYVISAGFLRLGEIYLRASVSAMCMAFLASDATRPMGTQWIKRFCAVCIHAGLIVIAINLAGLLYQFCSDVVAPIVAGDETTGDINYMVALFPCMIALFGITGLVKLSERVSNGIFGLAS